MNFILRPVLARQASDQEVIEGGTGTSVPPPLPVGDDVVAFRDQVGYAPEVEIRKGFPEAGHEGLDVIATSAGSRCSEYSPQLVSSCRRSNQAPTRNETDAARPGRGASECQHALN